MASKSTKEACCSSSIDGTCCKIESLISIDDRGQMVLPKEIREKAHINSGDKLALITWEKSGKICCINLVKADELGTMVKSFLGPMMNDISSK